MKFVGSPEATWHQGGASAEGSLRSALPDRREVGPFRVAISCCLTLNTSPASPWSSLTLSETGLGLPPLPPTCPSNAHPVVIFYIVSRSGLQNCKCTWISPLAEQSCSVGPQPRSRTLNLSCQGLCRLVPTSSSGLPWPPSRLVTEMWVHLHDRPGSWLATFAFTLLFVGHSPSLGNVADLLSSRSQLSATSFPNCPRSRVLGLPSPHLFSTAHFFYVTSSLTLLTTVECMVFPLLPPGPPPRSTHLGWMLCKAGHFLMRQLAFW